MPFCSNCGMEDQEGCRFCSFCGQRVSGDSAASILPIASNEDTTNVKEDVIWEGIKG